MILLSLAPPPGADPGMLNLEDSAEHPALGASFNFAQLCVRNNTHSLRFYKEYTYICD